MGGHAHLLRIVNDLSELTQLEAVAVEARWTEMIQSGGLLESNYGFSNIRIGVARAFGGP